jgi:hypothetical protein
MPIIKIPDCGLGVNLDLTPEELSVGVWSDCRNMRFKDGYAARFGGMGQIFDAPEITPHWITAYQTATKRWWVHAGVGKVYADDGSTRVEITRLKEIAITSITRSGTTATLTTTDPHGLTTGDPVTIYGALPSAYNVENATITVGSTTTFTYTMASDPGASANPVGHLVIPGDYNDFTGTVDDRWTGGALGGILVMNNGVDVPVYWAGDTNALRPLPGWDATERAEVITVFKQYIIALGITKNGTMNPNLFKWSVSAVPGAIPTSWNEADLTQDAGEVDIAETPDLLVDAKQRGDALVVYKQRSAYIVRLIGQPFIFQVQRLPGDDGAMFRGCIADTPNGHVVMTSGDVVLNNGQGLKSIADGRVRKYLFNNMDTTKYKRSFVTSNPQDNEVLICYPEIGREYCSKALVWNWKSDTWGIRDLHNATFGAVGQIDEALGVNTWNQDFDSWVIDGTTWAEDEYAPNEARLFITEEDRIVAFDVSGSDDGLTPLPSYIERTGMWLEDAQLNKLIRGIYPRIDAPSMANVTIKVGAAMVADALPAWSHNVSFVVGDPHNHGKADSFAQGKYLSINMNCSEPWRMRACDMDVVQTGRF